MIEFLAGLFIGLAGWIISNLCAAGGRADLELEIRRLRENNKKYVEKLKLNNYYKKKRQEKIKKLENGLSKFRNKYHNSNSKNTALKLENIKLKKEPTCTMQMEGGKGEN